jgi:hypothetical protein
MRMQLAALMLFALFAVACAQKPPAFPNQPPSQVAGYRAPGEPKGQEPPREPPQGVTAFVVMSADARLRAVLVLSLSIVAFLLVALISLPAATRPAFIPAGVASALSGPAVALLLAARRIPGLLMATRSGPTAFAQLSLDLWNENQPLLCGLYVASAALIIVFIATLRRSAADRSAVTTVFPLLTIAGASIAFAAFFTLNRVVVAVADPVTTDAIVQAFRSMSIAAISQAAAQRVITALVSALITGVFIVATVVLALAIRRRPRGAVLLAIAALVLVLAAAYLEQSWCGLLKVIATTGRVPA